MLVQVVLFLLVMYMKDKNDNLYYCFRYKCKRCPKQRECEDRDRKTKGDSK